MPAPRPPRRGGPSTGLIVAIIAVLVVIVIVLVAFFLKRTHEEQARQQAIADSIALVHRNDSIEAARIDSIRHNLTSPDLAFFNLHGQVKTLTQTEWGTSTVYHFDREGNCSDISQFASTSSRVRVNRNNAGYVSSFKINGGDEWSNWTETFTWKDGRLTSDSSSGWEWGGTTYFKYGNDGLISEAYTDSAAEGTATKISLYYTYNSFDDFRNWTSLTKSGRERHTVYGEYDEETVEKVNRTVTRVIEYYD